jgi:MSHA biogenesis protein MshN
MSLINQMLQDLELRRAGDLVGGSMQQQVRAVPERDGMHVAWWLVLLLSLLLAGACVWFWLRPPTPVVPPPVFALKLASDISALPSPAAQAPWPLDQDGSVPASGNSAAATGAAHAERRHAAWEKPERPESANSPSSRESKPMPMPAAIMKTTDSLAKASGLESSGEGDAATSTKLTKQIKELTPQQHAENDYREAGSALQQGRQADAIADLEQALQLDAQNAAARQMLVGVLLQAKRTDDAMRRAQEGLTLDPAQVGLAMILARVQVEKGDLRPALDTLLHSLPYARERADYQAFLAALLQRDKRHKDAIEHYVAALAKAPQNSVWWMGLGISLQAENRLPEAKEAFEHAKTSNTLTPALQTFVEQKLTQLQH